MSKENTFHRKIFALAKAILMTHCIQMFPIVKIMITEVAAALSQGPVPCLRDAVSHVVLTTGWQRGCTRILQVVMLTLREVK